MIETERLNLRPLTDDDAPFILELLNEPAFIRNIGDKQVRNLEHARTYIQSGPVSSYARYGFGLNRVALKKSNVPIGICGLLKRDSLSDPDLGFAFLSRYWSRGFASESARAVLEDARTNLGLSRILAITALDNPGSARVLEKVGLRFERIIQLPEYAAESRLFALSDAIGAEGGSADRTKLSR